MKSSTVLRIVAVALTVCINIDGSSSEAEAFGNRGRTSRGSSRQSADRQSSSSFQSSPYNPSGGRLTRFGENWIARKQEQDVRTAQRTGKPVEQVMQKRIHRIEMFGAAVGGLGAGLSAGASQMNFSSPTSAGPYRSSQLPSNFSQQSNWNSYNRTYSTNPYHAPVR